MTNAGVDRRGFLAGGASAAAALTTMSALAGRAEAAGAERPNFVWFLSEDNNPAIGAYGDPVARTPTLDQLAADGIRYETVHSAAPVCAPSRFALLTGKYAETCGPAHNMRAIARKPGWIRGFPEYLRAAGYYCTNNVKTDYNATVDLAATWDESSNTATWRNRPEGASFFAMFSSQATHESRLFPRTPLVTDPATVRIPPFLPDTPTTREDRARFHDNMERMDAELATRLAQLDADGLAEDTIVFYFGDNGGVLPRSKRFANDFGLRVPLIVRIPEKWRHLAPAKPGAALDTPVSCVDLPGTVLHLAGLPVPEHFDSVPFLGARRRERPHIFGQRSRMDERYDLQRSVRDTRFLYVRNYMPHRPYGQSMAYMWQQRGYQDWEQAHLDGTVTPLQEAFWDEKPAEELYDLDRDPDQLTNLVGAPRHKDDLHRLRKALDEHLLDTNDNGFIPEGSPLEGYDESRAPGAFPIKRVLAVAGAAIQRDADNLADLVDALGDDNEAVRYWAAQGLLILGDAAGPAVEALSSALDGDASPQVRVVVAEALARLGHQGRPVDFLAETADTHASVRVRLLALNALTYAGNGVLRHRDVIDRAAAHPDEYVNNAGRYLQLVLSGTYTPQTPVFD